MIFQFGLIHSLNLYIDFEPDLESPKPYSKNNELWNELSNPNGGSYPNANYKNWEIKWLNIKGRGQYLLHV